MKHKQFVFRKSSGPNCAVCVEHVITFPPTMTPKTCFHYLVSKYNVPPFAHDALYTELNRFFQAEKRADFLERYAKDLDWLTNGPVDLNELCTLLDTAYRKHTSACPTPTCTSDEVLFGQAYNRLVHSTRAKDLIRLEQSLALVVSAEVDKRDRVLRRLADDLINQTECELQKRDIDGPTTVTRLQESHIRMRELEEGRWDSIISELKRSQRIFFRDKVMSLSAELAIPVSSADTTTSESATHCINQLVAQSAGTREHSHSTDAPTTTIWSESFTVQLGRQLRTTCNFRLIRTDPMDLLTNLGSTLHHSQSSTEDDLAQRLSNALGLYSNELNGLVILVDKQINSLRGVKKRLFDACERSTEFHFSELGCQLADIQATLDRMGPRHSGGIPYPALNSPSDLHDSRPSTREPVHGDVYITRHSNLAGGIGGLAGGGGGISVVFHLVYDEAAESDADRVRSTSPLHHALSAILRTCFDYDVTTLSLPLLLVPTLREFSDASWRSRRAESVLKLLKGALMEWSTWRGPVVHSIQFLAPPGLPDKEMESYSHLITNSFLQPVPVFVPN
ncbi:unnamed protein product [Dicrocoelium dendriticum]|nr:unnamed protein product [Dicrocoelium dendriticum]